MTILRALFGLLALAILGGLGWLIWVKVEEKTGEEQAGRPPSGPVAVEIAPVRKADLRDRRLLTGTLVPTAEFVAAPKIGGRLARLHVDIGDAIERGDIIGELDDEEFVQQVEQARAELDVARTNLEESAANLEVAKREYLRIEKLRQDGISSESDLDRARTDLQAQQSRQKVAQTQVIRAEAALKAAEVRLSYTTIRADWEDGDTSRIVGERFVDDGEMLSANSRIVSVLEIDPIIAVLYIAEVDYPKLHQGQTALIRSVAYPGRAFEGQIARIAPMFREASRQARVEIHVANEHELLKPGMFVGVEVELAKAEGVQVVPIEALVERQGTRGVFVANREGNTAEFVIVETGVTEGGHAQVLSPDLEGAWVVTMGQHLLENGSSILATELDPKEIDARVPKVTETPEKALKDDTEEEKTPGSDRVPAQAVSGEAE
ncbi:MAG: efflux RND transporter periplasmic adaptor subunit [Planctomycetota bacterium]